MTMRRNMLPRLLAYTVALILLLLVFSLYLQPEFMVTMAQQLWACF
jgi:hypothetical protein